MLLSIVYYISISGQPALAGIHVMLLLQGCLKTPCALPALTGIHVMLRKTFDEITSSFMPALAGIRVVLIMAEWDEANPDYACISRYSCSVQAISGPVQKRFIMPALAGIRVVLKQKLIYCHYQLR